MTIAKLIVDVAANTASLDKEVKQINSTMQGIAGVATKVAGALGIAFSVGSVVNFARELGRFSNEMIDLSEQTGIGVEQLQAFRYVAVGAGTTVEKIADAVSQLGNRLTSGNAGAIGAVERLGLAAHELIRMSPDQAFIEIADAIRQIENPMEQSRAAMELFGKSGSKLLPLLKSDIAALTDEAKRNGSVISEEMIRKAAELDDAWSQLMIRGKALMAEVFIPMASAASGANFSGPLGPLMALAGEDSRFMPGAPKSPRLTGPDPIAIAGPTAEEILKIEESYNLKSFEAKQKAIEAKEKADTDYRAFLNGVYERQIEDHAAMLATQDEAEAAYRQLQNQLGEEEIARYAAELKTKEEADAAYRAFQNDLGVRRMEEEARQIELSRNAWKTHLDDLGKAFQQMAIVAGDAFSGIARAVGTAISAVKLATSSIDALKGGIKALGSGSVLSGITSLASGIGGIVGVAAAAYQGIKAIFSLFSGGEEAQIVNPARDKFLSQFGGPGTGEGSGFMNLARMLTEITGQHGGGDLFASLSRADTESAFRGAAESIVALLNSNGRSASMNFHTGGAVPGNGEVSAKLLGGEGVLSRRGMRALDDLNAGRSDGRLDLLVSRFERVIDELPRQLAAANAIQRGRGASYAH